VGVLEEWGKEEEEKKQKGKETKGGELNVLSNSSKAFQHATS
jgi:hypothetical protein